MSDNLQHPNGICSKCEKAIAKIFKLFHKAPAGGDTTKKRRKYTDETGRLWHGTLCPDCAAEWRKDLSKKHAESKKLELKKQIGE